MALLGHSSDSQRQAVERKEKVREAQPRTMGAPRRRLSAGPRSPAMFCGRALRVPASSVATDSGGHAVRTLRRSEWSCGVLTITLGSGIPAKNRLRVTAVMTATTMMAEAAINYCGPSHRDWRSNTHARGSAGR
jgi:hypothetical protein